MNTVPVATDTVFHTTKTGQRRKTVKHTEYPQFGMANVPGTIEVDDTTHCHVVEFINGCLNDYDSWPIETFHDAVDTLEWAKSDEHVLEGDFRYVNGLHILKIEECTERECLEQLDNYFRGIGDLETEVYGG